MLKKHSLMIKIMVLFFLVFFGAYIPLTQRIPYLTSLGYTATEMNLIFSIQAAIGFVYQLSFGFLCDKYKTIKKFFYLAQIVGTFGIFLMFSLTQHIFYFHVLSIALIGGMVGVTFGLMDNWALELSPATKENYGAVRGMGTLGWIVGGYFVTWVLKIQGYQALGLTYAIISSVLMLLASQLRDVIKVQHTQPITFNDLKSLILNKRYMGMVLILFFAMILSNSDGLVVVMKMETLHATDMEKYLRFALQAVVELPVLFLGGFLLKKFKAIYLLSFAIVMYAIRFVAYSFAPNAFFMIVVSMMQLVTFPFLMITSKQLIFDASPEHMRSSGQMVAMSIYSGIGATLTPLFTAFLIEQGGIDFSMLVLASIMIIPLILIVTLERPKAS